MRLAILNRRLQPLCNVWRNGPDSSRSVSEHGLFSQDGSHGQLAHFRLLQVMELTTWSRRGIQSAQLLSICLQHHLSPLFPLLNSISCHRQSQGYKEVKRHPQVKLSTLVLVSFSIYFHIANVFMHELDHKVPNDLQEIIQFPKQIAFFLWSNLWYGRNWCNKYHRE